MKARDNTVAHSTCQSQTIQNGSYSEINSYAERPNVEIEHIHIIHGDSRLERCADLQVTRSAAMREALFGQRVSVDRDLKYLVFLRC